MNPVLAATLRRHWPLFGAGAILVVLLLMHAVVFTPTASRYSRAVAALGGADAVLDPSSGPAPVPPRIFALVNENALPEPAATQRATSGQLTVMMLEDLSALASQTGLAVTLSEPGPITPLPKMIEVRVHLRVRGTYEQLVNFLHAIEGTGRIYDLERWAVTEAGGDQLQMELMAIRLVLKQPGGPR